MGSCPDTDIDLFTLSYLSYSTGLTNIITVDLHAKEIQGFYDAPVDNLRASPFLVQYITEKVLRIPLNNWWKVNFLFIIDVLHALG